MNLVFPTSPTQPMAELSFLSSLCDEKGQQQPEFGKQALGLI